MALAQSAEAFGFLVGGAHLLDRFFVSRILLSSSGR